MRKICWHDWNDSRYRKETRVVKKATHWDDEVTDVFYLHQCRKCGAEEERRKDSMFGFVPLVNLPRHTLKWDDVYDNDRNEAEVASSSTVIQEEVKPDYFDLSKIIKLEDFPPYQPEEQKIETRRRIRGPQTKDGTAETR